MRRGFRLPGLPILLAVVGGVLFLSWRELRTGDLARRLYREQASPVWLSAPHPGVPTRVFIVMDTVRSDPLSLCGYHRPTSPELEALVKRGARFTCDRADHNGGEVVRRLEARGWCTDGCRIVITSDHGEMLGAHGLLDHGHYVWQEVVRVPLLAWDTDGRAPSLPSPVNATEAYSLMLDWTLAGYPATSMEWPHVRRCNMTHGRAFCDTSLAQREGPQKLIWTDGAVAAFDLERDPAEQHGENLALGDPRRAELDAMAARVVADRQDGPVEPAVMELLKSAGYVE